jgi:hypothetical protein
VFEVWTAQTFCQVSMKSWDQSFPRYQPPCLQKVVLIDRISSGYWQNESCELLMIARNRPCKQRNFQSGSSHV